MRAALAAAFLAAFAAVLVLRDDDPVQAGDGLPSLETIAERVERLRGLEFDELPKVERVTARDLQKQAARELDRLGAAQRREARSEQDLLALLGFASRRSRVDDLASTAGIMGVYDPPSKTLTIVTDAQAAASSAS